MTAGRSSDKVDPSRPLPNRGTGSDQHEQASSSLSGHLSTLKSLWAPSMKSPPPSLKEADVLIGVMGMTGVGKTSFVKQITDLNMEIGHDLESCTKEIQLATTTIGGSVVRFIDTPGFDDTDTKDSDILKTTWQYMRNVILLTTMWGKLQPSDNGEARVKQLTETGKFWGGMISCGANHERYDGTKEDALRIVQMMLDNAPCKLQIQEEHDSGKKLADTTAGKEVADRLEALKAHHAQEMAEMKEQLDRVAQQGNEKLKQELQTLYKDEITQKQEIAEAQRKLQRAEIESLQGRLAELEGKGHCVVC